MSEVIVVTSGKGGVGKTTTSANVGTGLAMLGEKVILIDTDIGLRNLDVVMGLENRIVYNLVDVVEGNCRLKQALIKDKRYPNLFLLPSAQTRDKSSVTPGQMRKLVDDLREEFDYVLLDCPAGIEQGFKNAIAGADRAFVVTTPEVSRPNGAKPVKFFTMLPKIQSTPSLENRFADVTTSPEAGFVRATPITLKMQPMMAVIRKSQQNRIAGGGNLLQTFSIPSISLSTPVFLAVVFSLI